LARPKIQNLYSTVAGDEQVFRLQVAMHNALLVRRCQSSRHLHSVVNRLAAGERATPEPLTQGLPFQQLGDHVGRALFVPDVEDRKNIGMIEGRRRPCFLGKALHPVMVRGERRRQDFDRHNPIQPGILCAIHLAHPPRANKRLDLVRP
jgi:hypothetical protein